MNETFYGGFYGFRSAPFHITPDPALLFPTETHRAALGAIEYGIAAGKGFIVVTGEVGVGKTTVLRSCLDGLDASRTKIIYLFSPALKTAELYAIILDELDRPRPPTANAGGMLRVLHQTLLALHQAGTQVVLAVDEAQQMPEATLESLRILSNLETHKSKLLQIILVGQPELEAVLARHSLRQLAQRVAVRARVKRLTFRQSCRYIVHRTHYAGRAVHRPLFTTPALVYLAIAAQGVPRTLNICCDNALINGYGHSADRITLGIVRESCRSMKFRSPLRQKAALASVAMILVALLVGAAALFRHPSAPAADLRRAAPASADAAPAGAPTTTPPGPIAASMTPPHPALPSAAPLNAPPPAVARSGSAPDPASPAPLQAGQAETAPSAATPPAAPEAPAAPRAGSEGATSNPLAPLPAGERGNNSKLAARRGSKWVVRKGDTVYKACLATYGSCDWKALRRVIARNPAIGRDAKIYEGEVLFIPRQAGAATPN